ncbi:hypothetical protein [uncultured Halomonas sp.]|uniref:hypothetical protein n=1 Tax=uncultured Halomonas sp. TaxID=173971 RepID=UPI002622549D|nr:hypothetical protein [uncultured Halomonas sp.]
MTRHLLLLSQNQASRQMPLNSGVRAQGGEVAREIEFFGALANIEHGPEQNTVLQTLAREIDDFHLYKQVFQPGVAYASINWRGVLGRSAEVAAIAALLWNIYVDKVEPHFEEKKAFQPALIIIMKDGAGNGENIRIDASHNDREVFIRDFTEKVERLRTSADGEEVVETIETSEQWIKIE